MDLIEKIARACCVACEENPEHDGNNGPRWKDYSPCATAAIAAIEAAGYKVVPVERREIREKA